MDPLPDDIGNTEVLGMQPRTYCTVLHLSQLLGIGIPFAGFFVPIILWIIGKDKSPMIAQHGKIILNWMISVLIYLSISAVLCLVFIGFFLLFVLMILDVVFPIIGAVKANDGKHWKYPLSIPFFN